MSEKFRLLRQRCFNWLIGSPPQLLFHSTGRCPGHNKREWTKPCQMQ